MPAVCHRFTNCSKLRHGRVENLLRLGITEAISKDFDPCSVCSRHLYWTSDAAYSFRSTSANYMETYLSSAPTKLHLSGSAHVRAMKIFSRNHTFWPMAWADAHSSNESNKRLRRCFNYYQAIYDSVRFGHVTDDQTDDMMENYRPASSASRTIVLRDRV